MVAETRTTLKSPQRLKMSYQDYLEFAGDAKLVEWVDGEVITYMPPLYEHQRIVKFLSGLLDQFTQYFQLGTIIIAPFEVKLWPDGPAREPDLFFISQANQLGLTPHRFHGGPDLVIEVISPSSLTQDRVHKFTEYEKAGVREYWLIDPRLYQEQADFYILDDEGRFQPAPVDDDGIYRSTVLPDFWLRLDWLWAETLPQPQLALAEIMVSVEDLPEAVRESYRGIFATLSKR